MKNFLLIAIVGVIFYSCGEAGFQTNIGKEVSVETDFQIDGIPDTGIPIPDYNPPAETTDAEFDLGEITESVDELGEVVLNSISYEITGVEAIEEVDIDELSAIVELSGADDLELFNITGTLENSIQKETVTLTEQQKISLQNKLFNEKKLSFSVNVDLAEVPNEDGVDLTFVFYFDATVKVEVDL